MEISDIRSIESEAGVIATLIHNPDFYFHAEFLLPNHFVDIGNRYLYAAMSNLISRGIQNLDAYNIDEVLRSDEFKGVDHGITLEKIQELIDVSVIIQRTTAEEYKLLVDNIMNAAFRRDALKRLRECERLCFDKDVGNIEQRIYQTIDDVMCEYSSKNDIPEYKDVIDKCWDEIKQRGENGSSGIPFKFETLNEFVTIERGELVVFSAEQKQGKSMLLLNCAVDLLKRDKAVLYIDSELNDRLFTSRMLSHLSGIDFKRVNSYQLSGDENETINNCREWIKTKKFTHTYMPIFDTESIYTTVKKVQHTQGIDVLIIDYFKSSGDGDAFNSYQELGRFVDMVKNKIAGDMDIAAIGAAQATSTGKIADSAKIGRNASTIVLLQDKTPEEIAADGPECGNKKLRVVLNRNGMQMMPDEYIDMLFDGNHIMYSEAKQHIPTQPY